MFVLTITTFLPSTLKCSLKSGFSPYISQILHLPRSLTRLLLNFKAAVWTLSDLHPKQHLMLLTTVFLKLSSRGFSEIHLFLPHFLESSVGSISVCPITSILEWEHPKLSFSSLPPSPLPCCIPSLSERHHHPSSCPGLLPLLHSLVQSITKTCLFYFLNISNPFISAYPHCT